MRRRTVVYDKPSGPAAPARPVCRMLSDMTTRPGYDELAEAYAEAFPEPYRTPAERMAVRAFADSVKESGRGSRVLDVGCGTGGVALDLAAAGLDVLALDPSTGMLDVARRQTGAPVEWLCDDALLKRVPEEPNWAGLVARFSLIHVDPRQVPAVLAAWSRRLPPGGSALLAFQSLDAAGAEPEPFDHKVAPAWFWSPDALVRELERAGFAELWRLVSRPDPEHHSPECHLLARRTETA